MTDAPTPTASHDTHATPEQITENQHRVVSEAIQDRFDAVCERKGIESVDLSTDDALDGFPAKKDK